jgi:hypothetical protein
MNYPFLLFLLLVHGVHAVIFSKHYWKARKFHDLMLAAGFILLTGYYLSKTLGVETTTLLVVVRWTGITLAVSGGTVLLKAQLKSLKTWLMMNPTTMMLFLRIILAYVKFKDKVNKLFNKEERGGASMSDATYSKKPMYIMITLLSLILAVAWAFMLVKFKPDMFINGDTRIVYSHSKEEDVGFPYRFSVTVASKSIQIPADGVKMYWIKGEDFKAKRPNIQKSDFNVTTLSATAQCDLFGGSIPSRVKNTQYYMFLEVTDSQNNLVANLPANALANQKFFRTTYKMDPNIPGLLVHILLMMAALLFMIHTFYYAFEYIWNKQEWAARKSIISIFWGLVCYGISAFPLGIWIEFEKYGTYWTGFPLGWDITDSKTFFNFFYWLAIVILMKGTIFSKNKDKDMVSYKTYAWLAILGGILTMVVRFALPHGDL